MRLIGMASGKSRAGLTRIRDIVAPDIRLEVRDDMPKDIRQYSGVMTHNIIMDPSNGVLPWIAFFASSAANRAASSRVTVSRLTKAAAVWGNCEDSAAILYDAGIQNAKAMHRPNELTIPDECPPTPKTRTVLWHWLPDGMDMKPSYERVVSKAIDQIVKRGFKVQLMSSVITQEKPMFITEPVKTVVRINLDAVPKYLGMVRAYDMPGELGRSAFQVAAQGRWVLYWRTREKFVETVDLIGQIPAVVVELSREPREAAVARWEYVRREFNEAALHERWTKAVMEAIS